MTALPLASVASWPVIAKAAASALCTKPRTKLLTAPVAVNAAGWASKAKRLTLVSVASKPVMLRALGCASRRRPLARVTAWPDSVKLPASALRLTAAPVLVKLASLPVIAKAPASAGLVRAKSTAADCPVSEKMPGCASSVTPVGAGMSVIKTRAPGPRAFVSVPATVAPKLQSVLALSLVTTCAVKTKALESNPSAVSMSYCSTAAV